MATDLMNPEFLASLGFDPDTIIRPQGRVVIAFQNSSSGVAEFGATLADSLNATEEEFDYVYASGVQPNETRTLVVECSVKVITPGAPFGGSSLAVIVTSEEAESTLAYGGDALEEGDDFLCGDVIEIRVIETATDAENTGIALQVQVLPGQ
jgi:hypothetical protein